MDDFEYQEKNDSSSYRGYQNKRSDSMGAAALILGIISVTTPFLVFTSMICGPLAIIFGFLSKGGELETDLRGKFSIFLGFLGLILVTLIMVMSIRLLVSTAGGWDQFIEYYSDPSNTMPIYPDTL